ncbi:MAG: hypothetical protein ACI31S_01515 [Bacilli bacterium]
MKIIDLLNKISNGEIPIKIKYKNEIYIYQEDEQDYAYIEDGYYNWLLSDGTDISFLNEEVELIEDEVDIDNIKEIDIDQVINTDDKTGIALLHINKLVQAVKQLNKEIKSIKEK